MAKLFAKTLLSLVAACVAQGITLAQDVEQTFTDAVRLIRTNKAEEGLAKLRELVAASPDHETALGLVKTTDPAIWQLLLGMGGEYEQVTRHLMSVATEARKQMSRDDSAVRGLLGGLFSDVSVERRKAAMQLSAEHGEFAVPALLEVLGDADQSVNADRAMLAIFQIGRPAVMPLIAALESDNELLRRNCAAALGQIGDKRAVAPLAAIAANDANEAVREVAKRGLARLGVPADASAVALYSKDAEAYLTGVGVRDGDRSEVVWQWKDGALAFVDVPANLYGLELAKAWAHQAVRLEPANENAKTLLARSYLAEASAIKDSAAANPDDSTMQELSASVDRFRMVAMALGKDTLRDALSESLAASQSEVAVEAIEALGGVAGDGADTAPLLAALDASDARVRYAAALALVKASEGKALPSASKVVSVLGQAVSEEAIRAVLVVDANPTTAKAVREASSRRGVAIQDASSGKRAIADFYAFPSYDVVVVSDTLSDILPEDVISLVRERSPETKVLLLSRSEDSAARLEGKVDGVITPEGDLTTTQLIEKANEVAGELDPRRKKADKVAVAAAHSLLRLARENVNVVAAAAELGKQLDRNDEVAIPAAAALGAGGTLEQLGRLAALVTGESTSAELKLAAAEAVGGILSRSSSVPDSVFDALLAVASNQEQPLDLRAKLVSSLGRGQLAPGARSQLAAALRVIAQAGGE
ncbi:MAG: HEAT repeat domain-containing protein [Planctomycetota bacterium]